MPVFEVQDQNGKIYEVDAPDQDQAEAEFHKYQSEIPGPISGTARSMAEGMFGQVPNKIMSGGDPAELQNQQNKSTSFQNEYPVLSDVGGLAGYGAAVLGPMFGGRYLGGKIGGPTNRTPTLTTPHFTDPALAGSTAADLERQAVQRQYLGVDLRGNRFIGPEIATRTARARDAARAAANRSNTQAQEAADAANQQSISATDRANAQAQKWNDRGRFYGGIAGGAGGGALNSYLKDEDPTTGALYGGTSGLLPGVGAGVSKMTGNNVPGWLGAAAITGTGAALKSLGAPSWITENLDHYGLAKWFKSLEGKK